MTKQEELDKLAHEAPMNPYRENHDGHRWVEQYSYAWAKAGRNSLNEWMKNNKKEIYNFQIDHLPLSQLTDQQLAQKMQLFVDTRNGPAKDENGKLIIQNGSWAMMLEAAKRLRG